MSGRPWARMWTGRRKGRYLIINGHRIDDVSDLQLQDGSRHGAEVRAVIPATERNLDLLDAWQRPGPVVMTIAAGKKIWSGERAILTKALTGIGGGGPDEIDMEWSCERLTRI